MTARMVRRSAAWTFCLAAALVQQATGQELLPPTGDATPLAVGSVGDLPPEATPTAAEEESEPVSEDDVLEPVTPTPVEPIEPDEPDAGESPAESSPAAKPAVDPSQKSEVVEERYPNGTLKVVREVVQDAAGNFMNHGSWKMFNQRGAVIVEGQYYEDQRHGVWNRWYTAGEVPFLREKPFTDFLPPFVSQGIFDSGELHGAWIVYDAKQRKICEIRFNKGEREGVATWWHPTGRKFKELKFEEGTINGTVTQWSADGTVIARDNYDQGRRLSTQTVHFGGDAKKFTGQFLEPPLVAKQLDDWWKGEMATFAASGKSIKHGPYTAWHPNGQMRMRGEYKYDMPVGTFTWWYANGQKSLEGGYGDGKQEGEWNWWHENGQRSIRGEFALGNPSGKWTWWNKEGKVAQSGDFSDDKSQIVVTPMIPKQQAEIPAAVKPMRR